MTYKIILDGTLFSECEMMGSNRSGMLRLTEDITRNLVKINDQEIFFANTIYTEQYDTLLKKFIAENYPLHSKRIISKPPFFVSNVPKLRGLLKRFSKHLSLKVLIPQIERYDLFHSFYYPFPDHVQNKKIKKSITYLDIIPLRLNGYSENMVQTTKRVVESIVPNFAISISAFSRQDLIDYDKRIDPDRIFVAPLAASKELFFKNDNINEWKAAKEKYSLPDNYFLSVSSNDKRKNLHHLIRSFSKFIEQQSPKDLHLVLAGNFMYSYSVLDELNIQKAVREKIIITDKFIDNKDLSVVYSNSLCFFFMSHYEGFGLPVLEAMQCGVPVVTSNTSSIPEIVDSAGIMLPPDDQDALCEVMNNMYINKELRDTYAMAGLKRAAQFSWQRCAKEYAEIFKHINANF